MFYCSALTFLFSFSVFLLDFLLCAKRNTDPLRLPNGLSYHSLLGERTKTSFLSLFLCIQTFAWVGKLTFGLCLEERSESESALNCRKFSPAQIFRRACLLETLISKVSYPNIPGHCFDLTKTYMDSRSGQTAASMAALFTS